MRERRSVATGVRAWGSGFFKKSDDGSGVVEGIEARPQDIAASFIVGALDSPPPAYTPTTTTATANKTTTNNNNNKNNHNSVAGADLVLNVGGAQGIAALAYGIPGTELATPCAVIVGPGNKWVTAAKSIVAGR